MTGATALLLACWLIALPASAYFSGMETGIYALSKLRIRYLERGGDPRARILARLARTPESFVVLSLLGTNAANYAITLATVSLLDRADPGGLNLSAYTSVILTPVILVLGEMAPKDLFRLRADTWMLSQARFINALFVVLGPLIAALRWVTRGAQRLAGSASWSGQQMFTRRRFISMLHHERLSGKITHRQSRMAFSAMRLGRLRVRDIMVPFSAVATIHLEATRAEALAIIGRSPHTRYPLTGASRRDVRGMLNVQEFLFGDHAPACYALAPVNLAPGASVHHALDVLQMKREPAGIVRDHRGDALGLVTVRDIIEEIVGELADI